MSARQSRKRNRAACLPSRNVFAIVPLWLFTPQDIQKFADEASVKDPGLNLKIASDAALVRATQDLRMAFDWAIRCDQIVQWSSEPERARRWYQRIATHVNGLIEALCLSSAECLDATNPLKPGYGIPSIADFRQSIDCMTGVRPALPDKIDQLTRLAWQESGVRDDADDTNAGGKCTYRQRASFLIDRLPRTLALLLPLAEHHYELVDREPRRRGEQPDQLRRQLFKFLPGAHEATFGCKPRTRDKIGMARLGSVKWAKAVIEDASRKIEATRPAEAAKYVNALRVVARLSDATIASLLERGWKDWQVERSNSTAQ
jgi:hypothetical protein